MLTKLTDALKPPNPNSKSELVNNFELNYTVVSNSQTKWALYISLSN